MGSAFPGFHDIYAEAEVQTSYGYLDAEDGYQYLEIIQETRQSIDGVEFIYTPEDLDLPLQLFHLRQEYRGDDDMNAELDKVFDALIHGDIATARDILSTYSED